MTPRICKLGLGTVQWGMDYGVTNSTGKTRLNEVKQILSFAGKAGITLLDTAVMYGDAETVLGKCELTGFRVVTKTRRYRNDAVTKMDAQDLTGTFFNSLARIRQSSVYGLLVHHADDLLAPGGQWLIDAMQALKQIGKVSKIGVSVYDRQQIESLLNRFTPDIIQVPVNVLDQRLLTDGTLARLHALDIEIHARSAFLQGLLLMPPDAMPSYFVPWQAQIEVWHLAYQAQGLMPQQAALGFVCDLKEITQVIIGVESLTQLQGCLSGLNDAAPFDASGLACENPALLNPGLWNLS